MQLNEALTLVQQQFIAEAQGQGTGELRPPYDAALEKCPAMMAVAHHVWADELIRQNIAQAQQAAPAGPDDNTAPQN